MDYPYTQKTHLQSKEVCI